MDNQNKVLSSKEKRKDCTEVRQSLYRVENKHNN